MRAEKPRVQVNEDGDEDDDRRDVLADDGGL
jgi:hypothetical protein